MALIKLYHNKQEVKNISVSMKYMHTMVYQTRMSLITGVICHIMAQKNIYQ